MKQSDGKKAIYNIIWRFFERCGAQGVSFIVTIVLARLLEPGIYGEIALITVFTTVLQVFVDSGLGTALIQKKDSDDLDFSSVFYFNLLLCIVLYGGLFWAAPFIAQFYGMKHLTKVIRACGFIVIISGVKNIQQAYVSRFMLFKKFFFATLGGTIGAAVIGILMAYKGFGIWALVCQNLLNQFIDTVILWFTVKWRPKKMFSVKRLIILLSYGWKLLASTLLDVFYNESRQLIIGKKYTTSDLAFYNQGQKIPSLFVANINSSIDSVLLPSLSAEQEDVERIRSMVRRTIKISTYLMMPFLTGLFVCGESLVFIVLGEKWLPCVPYIRVFCIIYCFYVIHTANLNAIKALGKSDIFLKLEIVKKMMGFTVLLISMQFGVFAIALGGLLECLLGQIINSWPNRELLHYSYLEQIKDILPQMVLSILMGVLIYMISFLQAGQWLTLTVQILVGIFVYFLGSKILQIDSLEYIIKVIKKY